MMTIDRSKIALAAATVLFSTFAAAAEDASFPNLDTQKLCRRRASSAEEMMGDKSVASRALETCMKSEQDARTALAAAWKDIPSSYKASCIKPDAYSPSYAEWIACLELNIDVKTLRRKN